MVMKRGDLINSRYELVSEISRRGHRQKWIATSPNNERFIIETLHDTVTSDPDALRSIRYEIELSQKLNHDSFMHCVETFTHNQRIFLVWKYVDAYPLTGNTSLSSLTDRDICRYISRVVLALSFAHAQGVVHGALSTDTVLVTPTISPIIIGFPVPGQPIDTDPGIVDGISAYRAAAPELFTGSPLSETSDWYSIGIIARHMFREVHQVHQAQGISPTRLSSLQARNEETLHARKVIEELSSHDLSVRVLSAQEICSPEFLDSLSTPAHGNPVVTVEKKDARKIKAHYKRSQKHFSPHTPFATAALKALAIAAIAVGSIWLMSEIFNP